MFAKLQNARWTMRRKLLLYMLLLAALLLFALISGFVMIGRVDSAKKDIANSLDFQMQFFQKDIAQYFEALAASSIDLSLYLTDYLESDGELAGEQFQTLSDNAEKIQKIQEALLLPLSQRLEKQRCSGVFVILDATRNSSASDASVSRTGLYLYQNRFQGNAQQTLLRGDAAVGKSMGIMPHRKWRLEFRIDQFPSYDQVVSNAGKPLSEAYMLTDTAIIDGTADRVMFMAIPIVGSTGEVYGICGYEISADYFMTYHAQPSTLSRLTFLMAPSEGNVLDTSNGLSCGIYQDYYRPPVGSLQLSAMGKALVSLVNKDSAYVGVTEELSLTPNNSAYTLVAMMTKSDYRDAVFQYYLQIVMLLIFVLFFAVTCCIFFSRRYLRPILSGLEQLKTQRQGAIKPDVPEIQDLFEFLAEQDRQHEATVETLRGEKASIQEQLEHAQSVYAQAQTDFDAAQANLKDAQQELDRLVYARKNEIDPKDYEYFLTGIRALTKTEREIFEWYLEGKAAKEILELAGIKESTLKYHNHNILGKLGVSSRKQMLRYATLMKQKSL